VLVFTPGRTTSAAKALPFGLQEHVNVARSRQVAVAIERNGLPHLLDWSSWYNFWSRTIRFAIGTSAILIPIDRHGRATIIAMQRRNPLHLLVILAIGAIALGLQAADVPNANSTVRILALPDHGQGNITMDYIAYDPQTGYVWVPAINIGSVDVVDTSNGTVREISGFATKEIEVKGRKRAQGPSGVSIGNGVVYIGDRADSSVCALDQKILVRKTCGHIDSTPDGVVYVAPTKEVWVYRTRRQLCPYSGQPDFEPERKADI
jgi:hypothetical protein